MKPFRDQKHGRSRALFSGRFIYQVLATGTLTLFLLILSVCFLFYRFFSGHTESETISYIAATLKQADNGLAMMFGSLQSEGEMILSSDAVAGMLVDTWNVDPAFSYETAGQMKHLCRTNELANEISLYLIKDDVVLTSQSECGPLSEYSMERQQLLSGSETGVVCKNGGLYLLLQYPRQEPMARMVIRLNESVLRRSLLNETSSIYVFDRDLQPLFTSIHYPTDLKVSRVVQKTPQVFACTSATGDYLVAYRSLNTQLVYLCRSADYSSRQTRLSSLRQILPAVLLLLFGAAAYSYALFRFICGPIQRMLDLILHSAPAAGQNSKNLKELLRSLSSSLQDISQRDQRISEAASTVAPQLLERLFRRILFEGLQSPEVIERELLPIRGAFPQEQPYMVACISLWYAGKKQTENDLRQIHLIYLQELCRRYWANVCPAVILTDSEGRLVLVLSCTEGSGALQQRFEEFLHEMEKITASLSFRPVAGRSEALSGLSQMAALYAEAVQMLNRALYALNSSRGQSVSATALPAPWRRYLRDVQDAALKGQQHEAQQACRALADALQQAEDPAAALAEVHEALCRRVEIVTGKPAMLPAALQAENTQLFLEKAVSVLVQNSRECQMDYLEAAQACIAEAYADASLSLDEVSRRVGISGPYLSSLFTTLTEEHFLDYLNRYRIERACELLKNTNLSIAEVGFQVGFNSSSSFIRVFKKYRQVPPGSYRSEKRK